MAKDWPSRPDRLPALPQGRVHVHWIPGHTGITGNEAADRQANLGAITPASALAPSPPTRIAWARRALKKNLAKCFEEYWATYAPHSYKKLAIPLDPRPLELSLPRGSLGRLLAARSGHGDFAAYHEHFNHSDALLPCSCGQPKPPQHFFHCPLGKQAAPHPWRGQPAREVLGTNKGALLFHQWLQQSSFYSKICPAYKATTRSQSTTQPSPSRPWPTTDPPRASSANCALQTEVPGTTQGSADHPPPPISQARDQPAGLPGPKPGPSTVPTWPWPGAGYNGKEGKKKKKTAPSGPHYHDALEFQSPKKLKTKIIGPYGRK